MAKFKKKPVIIEAVQLTENTFSDSHPNPEHVIGVLYDPVNKTASVETLEGVMTGNLKDWLITGVKGEHYFCKDDIFRMTYEPAESKASVALYDGVEHLIDRDRKVED